MNTRAVFLAVLVLLAMTVVAQARLGESLDQLQARLGPPAANPRIDRVFVNGKVYPFGQILNFSKEGWFVECVMVNGVCVKITYVKNAPFTDDDIATILKNETQDSSWAKSVSTATMIDSVFLPMMNVREWKREDGATAQIVDKIFTLITPAYTKAHDAASAQGAADGQKKMPDL